MLGFVRSDEPGLKHAVEHHTASFPGQFGIHQRRVHRGGWGQACDQGGLRKIELVGRLGEVDPGGIGQAVGAGAEINVVEVLLENLLLAELTFELVSQGRFLELARQRAVLTKKHCAGQLLGDCAGSFSNSALADVSHHGSSDSPEIHAVVVVEAAIFRSDEGLLHQQRHLPRLDFFAGGRPELLNDSPVAG